MNRSNERALKLARILGSYLKYHRNPKNKATHFIGIPTVIFSVLLPLSLAVDPWLEMPLSVYLIAGTLIYYVTLSVLFAFICAFPLALLGGAAITLAENATTTAVWIVFGMSFAVGWFFQLLGHYFEGNRPALLDNLSQIFTAPLFLVAEVLFSQNLLPWLRDEMEKSLH